MKLTYYGTAAAEGWPGLFCTCEACKEARKRGGRNLRTRSQAAVDDRLLIDFPPDTYLHMLFYGLDLPNIDNCIITHPHEDHLFPTDIAYRRKGFCNEVRETPFTLYGSHSVTDLLRQMPKAASEDPSRIQYHTIHPFEPFEVDGYTVTALKANHARWMPVPIECFIYMIEKDGKRLLYGHDTGDFPADTWQYIDGRRFDLISLDCTTILQKDGGNHMGIEDVVEMKLRLLSVGCADESTVFVVNHFSHNGKLLYEELCERMAQYGILVSYDGMQIEF